MRTTSHACCRKQDRCRTFDPLLRIDGRAHGLRSRRLHGLLDSDAWRGLQTGMQGGAGVRRTGDRVGRADTITNSTSKVRSLNRGEPELKSLNSKSAEDAKGR